jgi:hypothetical protein
VQNPSIDCDANGLIDLCEIAANPSLDLNHDGYLDSCPLVCQPYWHTDISSNAGMDSTVNAMIVFDDGTGPALYAGGAFQNAGGVPANGVAKWDGVAWSPVGGGAGGGSVSTFAIYDDGTGPGLYAGGNFTSAGGVSATGIARWDGHVWSPIAGTPMTVVSALAVCDYGTGSQLCVISAGGAAGPLYRFNGSVWVSISLPALPGCFINALASFDDGSGSRLYVGGEAYGDTALLAKWDGTVWTLYYGPSPYGIRCLTTHDDGSGPALYAGWSHLYGGGAVVAKFDGANFTSVGSPFPSVSSIYSFDAGTGPELFACGNITHVGYVLAQGVAHWDGSTWSALGAGTNSPAYSLCPFDDGLGAAMYVGGSFTSVNNTPANRIASWGLPGGCIPTGRVICEPGIIGTMQCPCSNPPTSLGRGCENSSSTGGASLTTTGLARLGTDNLAFVTGAEKPGALSIVLQGITMNASGATFGQGVRCVAGSLKRLYIKSAIGGTITAPGAGDPSVSSRSTALGDVIAQGMHRFYGVYYRDPVVLGGCPATSTFNMTQQLDVLWHP